MRTLLKISTFIGSMPKVKAAEYARERREADGGIRPTTLGFKF
jgi:hypothetical protein